MITFSDDMNFYINGERVMVIHLHNGHTDGDAIVYFTNSNVIHTGDLFFKGKYPFIDTNSGGTPKGYLNAIYKIIGLADEDTKIIPGHGDLANIEDLRETQSMLRDLIKKVTQLKKEGKTEDQIASMKEITAPFDAKGFGDGFIKPEKFLRILYQVKTGKGNKKNAWKKK